MGAGGGGRDTVGCVRKADGHPRGQNISSTSVVPEYSSLWAGLENHSVSDAHIFYTAPNRAKVSLSLTLASQDGGAWPSGRGIVDVWAIKLVSFFAHFLCQIGCHLFRVSTLSSFTVCRRTKL